jgi:putative membrane protein
MNKKVISKIVASLTVASMLTYYASPVFAYINEETIYSKLDSEGKNYKSSVTTITEDENGTKTVQSDSDEDLPIECKISYYLDGKEMSAKEIAGKSGRVTIKLDYTNKEENKLTINGTVETLYTPFVVVSGVVLDNEKNKNIEVTNGKLITNGNKVIAVGMAMPGMQESLNLDEDTVKIPSSIEISLDTNSFEMGNIISYASPKMFGDLDVSIDDFDEIFSQVDELESASKQIEDGAVTLKNGTTEILSGTSSLKDGINSAYNGSVTIKNAVDSSISSLSNNSSNAIDDATLENIKSQAASSAVLSEEQKSAIKAQAESQATLSEEQKSAIKAQAESQATLSEEQKLAIKAQAESQATLSEEQKASIKLQAESSVEATQTQIEASAESAVRAQLGISDEIPYEQLPENAQNMIAMAKAVAVSTAKTVSGQVAVSTAQSTAIQTAGQVAVLTAQSTASQTAGQTAVVTAQNIATEVAGQTAVTVAQTTATTTATQTAEKVATTVGNEAKAQFTSQVVSQMGTLSNGLAELTNGLSSLNSGASSLLDGTTSLDNGVQTLVDGIKTFNTDGIQKITSLVNNDLKNVITRVEKLEELSNDYTNYASSDKRDDIKFITITDSIKLEQVSSKDEEDNKKK